jgi:hypothetical protein
MEDNSDQEEKAVHINESKKEVENIDANIPTPKKSEKLFEILKNSNLFFSSENRFLKEKSAPVPQGNILDILSKFQQSTGRIQI